MYLHEHGGKAVTVPSFLPLQEEEHQDFLHLRDEYTLYMAITKFVHCPTSARFVFCTS